MSDDLEIQAVRVRIFGRVQGVWYRGWTQREANRLGLLGWVRNRRDNTVEALFVGPKDDVEMMLRRCNEGPSAAIVDEVDVEPAEGITPRRFEIKPTV